MFYVWYDVLLMFVNDMQNDQDIVSRYGMERWYMCLNSILE